MKNLVNKLDMPDQEVGVEYNPILDVPYTLPEEYKKIADFMGYTYRNPDKTNGVVIPGWYFSEDLNSWICKGTRDLKFKYSWQELMRVVLKIESLKSQRFGGFKVIIHEDVCTIQAHERKKENTYSKTYASKTKINSVYQSVLLFIDWYNKYEK